MSDNRSTPAESSEGAATSPQGANGGSIGGSDEPPNKSHGTAFPAQMGDGAANATPPANKRSMAAGAATKKAGDVPKKRGNKGDFHGQRLDFLEDRLPEYFAASRDGKTSKFWASLFEDYWSKFYWGLALDEEPTGPAPMDGPLTQAQQQEKERTIKPMKQKLKNWYNHRPTSLGLDANPFTPWLARLRRPTDAAPKRITDYQFYMQHIDFKGRVAARFDELHWDAPRTKHLSLRCAVAREMFEQEPQAVKNRIREEAAAELREERSRYADADLGLPSVEEADRAEARLRFSPIVQPLLAALRAYTGYHVTLMCGRGDDGKTRGDDGSEDGGVDWTAWDKAGYTASMDQFMRFLMHAGGGESGNTSNARTQASKTPTAGGSSAAPPPAANDLSAPTPPPPSDHSTIEAGAFESDNAPVHDDARASNVLPPDVVDGQPPSLGARMAALPLCEPALQKEVGSLSPRSAEKRILELEGMAELELQRTNNVATKMAELAVIEAARGAPLGDMERELLLADDSGVRKRKGAPKKRKGAKRSKKSGMGGEKRVDNDDDSSEEDDEGERSEPPVTRGGAKEKTATTPNRPGAVPEWAEQSFALLIAMDALGGPPWQGLCNTWWEVERASGFATGKALPAKKRPKAVGWWIQRARTRTPEINDVGAFAVEWGGWWRAVNPGWRCTGSGAMICAEGKNWEVLRGVTGINGLLSVLMCLKWWRETLDNGEGVEVWAAAVEDVTWVLQQLLSGDRADKMSGGGDTTSARGGGGGSARGGAGVAAEGGLEPAAGGATPSGALASTGDEPAEAAGRVMDVDSGAL
ncbi:hypothetical protein B0H15DRAFT_957613 [Mycena belliarum]|uniref:Uncharacterized protein n=1 Tax=Mycena belliarum TaxID=1033014 RepID=A0AAD6XLD2_9AGAR|nr:hypothetical protein B0H15DRAFT_957613 [Mycena belliae]